jgi:hypothetical protein
MGQRILNLELNRLKSLLSAAQFRVGGEQI